MDSLAEHVMAAGGGQSSILLAIGASPAIAPALPHIRPWRDGRTNPVEKPIGDKVLVLTDQMVHKTSGGIFISEEMRDRMSMAAEAGIVVDLGDGALEWSADRARPFSGQKPKPGDFVNVERYAGQVIMGNDGQTYRIMSDASIAGIKLADPAS